MHLTLRGIVLFAHGSRDARWREPVEAVAARVAQSGPGVAVRCAYLEAARPDLPTAVNELVSEGVGSVDVLPLFLGVGKHLREDLPRLLTDLEAAYPAVTFRLRRAVGETPEVIDVLAQLAIKFEDA
ncbi:CbiX/SirB N-terminal domain-containing protein [Variovorax sp. J22R133]|uniref:sirohydrochlorin chelatase n=1 Tax=Variovorax brevis TaxID=3053503 RepID=UPI0025771D9A|nr:CbiX/SirB N-terminal domain-containing protein [Variovorax sp. J22R133]MDM0110761.1 CbiX/SirB N-terminal domain-containing protein [Variovorax sp. J22R133]